MLLSFADIAHGEVLNVFEQHLSKLCKASIRVGLRSLSVAFLGEKCFDDSRGVLANEVCVVASLLHDD